MVLGHVEDDGRGLGAWPLAADLHDGIEPAEGLDLALPLRAVGKQRLECLGEAFWRGSGLQKLWNDILAKDQIGQNDARQPDQEPQQPDHDEGLDRRHPISRDSRYAGERELERDRAGCRQRRAATAKGGPFLGRIDHDPRGDFPAGDRLAHLRGEMGQGRQHEVHRAGARGHLLDRGAEGFEQMADFASPASRQDQHNGRIRTPPLRLLGIGPQFGNALDQGMADIATRRAAELDVQRRLERQDGEHLIDISAHGAGATGPPRPDRGRHVIEDRDFGREPAHAARDAVGEIGTVDDHQCIRARGDHGGRGLANPAKNHRQPARDCRNAHDRKLVDGEWTDDASRRHGASADPVERQCAAVPRFERTNQRRAERIAGFFGGDDINRDRSGLRLVSHRAASSPTPATKMLSPSAAAITSPASAMMVEPAATATPASPARATPSMVRGPIDGRSKRRSWPGFGALTRTPVPGGVVTRPWRRRSAIRASIWSVPSAASTASTWLLATTAACPTSKGPSAAINVMPRAMSLRSDADGWWWPSTPSGTKTSGATSRTPMTRRPPSSAMLAIPDSNRSSPPRKARIKRGINLMVRQSSRNCL